MSNYTEDEMRYANKQMENYYERISTSSKTRKNLENKKMKKKPRINNIEKCYTTSTNNNLIKRLDSNIESKSSN